MIKYPSGSTVRTRRGDVAVVLWMFYSEDWLQYILRLEYEDRSQEYLREEEIVELLAKPK